MLYLVEAAAAAAVPSAKDTSSRAKLGLSPRSARGHGVSSPSIRHFMSNLPKTVEAQPVKLMKWLSKTIDEIYHAKFIADWFDIRDGDPLQNLPDFATEYLLTVGFAASPRCTCTSSS